MSDKLKPCPFCGGEAVYSNDYGNPEVVSHAVMCLDPDCGATITGPYKDVVIAAWNRRAPMEKAREALADLIELARAAMKDANRDGGEYDVRGELEEAQSALAALDGK